MALRPAAQQLPCYLSKACEKSRESKLMRLASISVSHRLDVPLFICSIKEVSRQHTFSWGDMQIPASFWQDGVVSDSAAVSTRHITASVLECSLLNPVVHKTLRRICFFCNLEVNITVHLWHRCQLAFHVRLFLIHVMTRLVIG